MRVHENVPDYDELVADWLERDPELAPPTILDVVAAAVPSISQRRRAVLPSWMGERRHALIGALAIAGILVVGLALIGLTRNDALSVGGPGPIGGADASTTVGRQWNPSGELAFTINLKTPASDPYYWRVATYDVIEPTGWRSGPSTFTDRPANSNLLAGMADDVDDTGRKSVTFTVVPATFRASLVISPATPVRVDVATRVSTIGRNGYVASIDTAGASTYTVTALVGQTGDRAGQWNVDALRRAGTSYPTEIKDLYLKVAPGSIGPNAQALQQRVRAAAAGSAPIDLVEAMMRELRSTAYTYNTDVTNLDCEGLSTVECFATYKQGFCQYYAATMAVLLRNMGVPTRIVEGFLPGQRNGTTEIIRNSNALSWVEVYFPGYGWVTFDPTGAKISAPPAEALPSGQ